MIIYDDHAFLLVGGRHFFVKICHFFVFCVKIHHFFVLFPLKEICPKWIHPIINKEIDVLIKNLPTKTRNEITRVKESAILEK